MLDVLVARDDGHRGLTLAGTARHRAAAVRGGRPDRRAPPRRPRQRRRARRRGARRVLRWALADALADDVDGDGDRDILAVFVAVADEPAGYAREPRAARAPVLGGRVV